MMKSEFENLAGRAVTDEQYRARLILRVVRRDEIRQQQAAGDTERVPCRHGSSRTFCCNLLFGRGGNQGY